MTDEAYLFLLPLLLMIQGILTAGLSLIIATWNAFYRDVQHIVVVALMLLFYLTPVFYRPQAVAAIKAGQEVAIIVKRKNDLVSLQLTAAPK